MPQICLNALDEGDELGISETPQCCDAITDKAASGYQCGQCDSFVSVDANRVVTYVRIN
ncbi:MAG: hypothetical protein HOV92_12630 [Streptomyces sp.]|nr:hypothetical protein [Streptomyces sp.]